MYSVIKLIITIIRELLIMTFTEKSSIVKSYVLLITAGIIEFEDVPNVGNLRDVVEAVLTQ